MNAARAIVGGLTFGLLVSCAEVRTEAPGLHLVSRTDMTVPEPIGAVGIYVQRIDEDGTTRTVLAREAPTYIDPVTGATCLPDELDAQGRPLCYVPLESAATLAVRGDTYDCKSPELEGERCQAHTVALPPGLCRRARADQRLQIIASPLCQPPSASTPICRQTAGGAGARSSACLSGATWKNDRDDALLGVIDGPVETTNVEPTDAGPTDAEPTDDSGSSVEPACVTLDLDVLGLTPALFGEPSGLWLSSLGGLLSASVMSKSGHLLTLSALGPAGLAGVPLCLDVQVGYEGRKVNEDSALGYRLLGDESGPLFFLGLDQGDQAGSLDATPLLLWDALRPARNNAVPGGGVRLPTLLGFTDTLLASSGLTRTLEGVVSLTGFGGYNWTANGVLARTTLPADWLQPFANASNLTVQRCSGLLGLTNCVPLFSYGQALKPSHLTYLTGNTYLLLSRNAAGEPVVSRFQNTIGATNATHSSIVATVEPSMGLAVAGEIAYLATTDGGTSTLRAIDTKGEALVWSEVLTLTPMHRATALQVVGDTLYWLETWGEGAARSTALKAMRLPSP